MSGTPDTGGICPDEEEVLLLHLGSGQALVLVATTSSIASGAMYCRLDIVYIEPYEPLHMEDNFQVGIVDLIPEEHIRRYPFADDMCASHGDGISNALCIKHGHGIAFEVLGR